MPYLLAANLLGSSLQGACCSYFSRSTRAKSRTVIADFCSPPGDSSVHGLALANVMLAMHTYWLSPCKCMR
ncbi:hypothetical protein M441DRAFT_68931 [Trichoderma asperellum CBS 433.97]|uniref:Uncharacterized protein n=1 Tax=Trichoderma asperellum (strain ATCC 204424 / CBS 433.97 / NBRC 101777) TaxID=1042311 RepID=A0A2T3Z6S7_TRIA4|nr:hypothetical protein M441DRAFT_68931 [Trichoderma asperellum CBS 433.97]PTB40470.1 hypothetical protein M441DRAFT_68931 [Trichoderma asperellum CBS 433.97]